MNILKCMPNPKLTFKFAVLAIFKVKNWWIYYLDLFRIIDCEVIYRLRDELQIIARAGKYDKDIIGEVLFSNLYDISKFTDISNNPVIVDIGAHIGTFDIYISTRFKSYTLYAFEPNEESYNILKRNLAINKIIAITFNKAVAGNSGKCDFYVPNNSYVNATTKSELANVASKKVTVDTISLLDILQMIKPKLLDILKIDCEGAEYEILYSLKPLDFKNIKNMIIEYHNIDKNMNNGDSLIKYLNNNGYKVARNEYQSSNLYGILHCTKD